MKLKLACPLILLFLATKITAHEGHGIPGALPPPPHGGVVAETQELGVDIHGGSHVEDEKSHQHGAEEKELFFEAVYQNAKVRVYPLTFGSNTSTFVPLLPNKVLKNVSIKVEFPRQKRIEVVALTIGGEMMEFDFDWKKVNRIIVHVTAEFEGEQKSSKLQIERYK